MMHGLIHSAAALATPPASVMKSNVVIRPTASAAISPQVTLSKVDEVVLCSTELVWRRLPSFDDMVNAALGHNNS